MRSSVPLFLAVLTLTSAYRVPEETPGNPSVTIRQEAVDGVPKAEEPIILPPISSKQGPELALLMVPGAYINAAAYQPLGEAIQAASPLRLWVGLVRPFAQDLPNPVQCGDDIELTLQMMFDQGMNASTTAVIGGHSLGGVVMLEWIFSHLSIVSGMILMASELGRALASVTIPILHITGDLDGMARVQDNEHVFRELEEIVLDDPSSVVTKPVVMLEDLNHMLFASGAPPPKVLEYDILSPVSEEEGHALYALHMSAFITAAIGEPQDQLEAARIILEKDFVDTKEILRPLMEMRDLTAGETSSPWASTAQLIISNVDPSFSDSVVVNDTIFSDVEPFEANQPVIVAVGETAVVNTYSLVTYPGKTNYIDPISAEELAIKLKGKEAVAEILSPIGVPFLNGSTTCREINEAAIAAAVSSASDHVTERYYSRGRQLVLLEDVPQQSGPQWLNSTIQYNETEDSVFVQSSSLITALGVPFGFDGMHYCKLMPPSRALEYIMLEGLRGTEPAILTKVTPSSSQQSPGLDFMLSNKRLKAAKSTGKNLGEKPIQRQKPNEVVAPLVHPVMKSLSEQKTHAKYVEPDGRTVHENNLSKSLHEKRIHDIDQPETISKTREHNFLKDIKGLPSTILLGERLEEFEVLVRGDKEGRHGEDDREQEAKKKDRVAENHDEQTKHVKNWFLNVKNGLGEIIMNTDFMKRPKSIGKVEKHVSERMAGTLTSDEETRGTLTNSFQFLFHRGIMSHIVGKLAENTEHYMKPLMATGRSYWNGVGDEDSSQDHHSNNEESKASRHLEEHSDHLDVDEKRYKHRSDHKHVDEKHHQQRSDHMDVDKKHHKYRTDHMQGDEKHHEHRSDHRDVDENN